jgi:hypothetical protein
MSETKHKLAIVVPYRDREENIAIFLPHLKKYLTERGIDHTIYIVEQETGKTFHRGLMRNIGFLEAASDHDYFVFHDVDMIPVNADYSYESNPTHLAISVSQFNYGLPYEGYFGGVVMFTKENFRAVNGYSNGYVGWGGEDDDLLYRCHLAGFKVQRKTPGVFKSLDHPRGLNNVAYEGNVKRIQSMWRGELDWKNEGLNTSNYSVISKDENSDRTIIKVSI